MMGAYDLREVKIRGETLHVRPIGWSDDNYDDGTVVLRYESVCPITGERIEILPDDIGSDGDVHAGIDVATNEKIYYSDKAEDIKGIVATIKAQSENRSEKMPEKSVVVHIDDPVIEGFEEQISEPDNSPFQDPYKAGELKPV